MVDKAAIVKLLQDAIGQFNSVLKTIEESSNSTSNTTINNITTTTTTSTTTTTTTSYSSDDSSDDHSDNNEVNSTLNKNGTGNEKKKKTETILRAIDETCDKITKNVKEYTSTFYQRRKAKRLKGRKYSTEKNVIIPSTIDNDVDNGTDINETEIQADENLPEKQSIIKLVPIEQLLNPLAVMRSQPIISMQTIVLDSDDDDVEDFNHYINENNDVCLEYSSNHNNKNVDNTGDDKDNDGIITKDTNKQSMTLENNNCKRSTVVLKRLPKNLDHLLKKYALSEVYNSKYLTRKSPPLFQTSDDDVLSKSKKSHVQSHKRSVRTHSKVTDKEKNELTSSQQTKRSTRHNKRDDSTLSSSSSSSSSSSKFLSSATTILSKENSNHQAINKKQSKKIKTNNQLTNGDGDGDDGGGEGEKTMIKSSDDTNKSSSCDETLAKKDKTNEKQLKKKKKDKEMSSKESTSKSKKKSNTNKLIDNSDGSSIDDHIYDSNDDNEQCDDDNDQCDDDNDQCDDDNDQCDDDNDQCEEDNDQCEEDNDQCDDDNDDRLNNISKSSAENSSNQMGDGSIETNKKTKETTSLGNVEFDDNNDDSDDFQIGRKKVKRKPPTSSENETSESDKGEKKKRKRRRIKKGDNSSSDDDNDKSPTKGRKNIKKIIKTRDLEDETKKAAREESERKKRIEDRQKIYNEYYDIQPEKATELEKLILDFDENTKEELVSVDRKLVRKLKPHQGSGVKFMWDTCFETIERAKDGNGSGCILAHCMGLGKSLQVITLVHTLFTHSEHTAVGKVLIICPLSTVLNWVNEFKMWLQCCSKKADIEIYEISKYKQNSERVYHIGDWHTDGGVLIMGYDMFRNLSNCTTKGRLSKKSKDILQKSLVDPGPDLVICDEGHLLKNSKTSLSKAVNRIRTLRRIVLTGTPLQNNLNEYYCMVQFVKPNLLGKYNEYLNRFVNPITNGQYVDSTPRDISMMKKRSHILHKLLDGCVQRRDYSVLAPYLPFKQEFVVFIKLTPMQVNLYQYYMNNKPARLEASKPGRTSVLFADFQNLQRIWTHPRVLRYNSDKYEINAQKKRDLLSDNESDGSIKDFIDDDTTESSSKCSTSNDQTSSDDSDSGSHKSGKKKKNSNGPAKATRRTRSMAANTLSVDDRSSPQTSIPPPKEDNPTEWWMSMCPEEELDNLSHSGKLMLLMSLLEECEQIGDKLLVFSQSLYSLDVIEHFLARIDEHTQNPSEDNDEGDGVPVKEKLLGGYTGSWSLGIDYFRLDGSTNIENRNNSCNLFNKKSNTRARLFLISTRAGGLGINLVAANRVIIFDVSWNPSHDIQSIFRVYRFGQIKPCYIYRFIAMGTMEEKIYERQVTKLAISKRVIDEHQIDRHYKENDLMELYKMNLEPTEPRPTPLLPKDRMFAGQLKKFDSLIYRYHEHDSLLENKENETLNEDEIKAAWEEFEAEKKAVPVAYTHQPRVQGMGPVTSNTIFGFRSDILLQLLNLYARQMYPTVDEYQLKQLVPLLLQQLYEKMRNGDTSMYNTLLVLQQKLETPSYLMAPNSGMVINPFSAMANQQNPVHMQQQQIIAQVQNRLIQNVRTPQPSNPNTVIELD